MNACTFSYFFFSLLFRVINNNLIQVDDDVPIDVALDRISLDLTAPRSSSAQPDILFADYIYKDKSPPTSSVIVGWRCWRYKWSLITNYTNVRYYNNNNTC